MPSFWTPVTSSSRARHQRSRPRVGPASIASMFSASMSSTRQSATTTCPERRRHGVHRPRTRARGLAPSTVARWRSTLLAALTYGAEEYGVTVRRSARCAASMSSGASASSPRGCG